MPKLSRTNRTVNIASRRFDISYSEYLRAGYANHPPSHAKPCACSDTFFIFMAAGYAAVVLP